MAIMKRCETCGLTWQVGRVFPMQGGKYECPKCELKRTKEEKKHAHHRRRKQNHQL